jgi:hypothetical protein
MSGTSVVLGAYTGMPVTGAEPFASSLRATGFQGRLVIFTGLLPSRADEARLSELADEVVCVDGDYPAPNGVVERLLRFLGATRGLRRSYPFVFQAVVLAAPTDRAEYWRRLEYHLEGLQSLRYLHYLRYLTSSAADADVVMLTDVRDVYFQRDPFAEPVTGLELYLEDDSVRIGHDAFNTRWLRHLYGDTEVERLRGRPVSCSGTVIGTRAAVVSYLEEMTSELLRRRRPMGSHDQGVHNGLLLQGRLRRPTVVRNGSGRVLTLGRMRSFASAADGTVLNADGSVPAVLHQWDRHAALVERFAS